MPLGPDVSLQDPAFIHPSALIYGKVKIGRGVSVWPQVVMRAEFYDIEIGEYTNIQDFVMIHVGSATPTRIGAYCSITHHCIIHGCTIGDNCLIGINATIMDGCVIGDNCTIAGGSFLKEGTVIPDNSIVMGTPGKVTRSDNGYIKNRFNAFLYHRNALAYADGRHREWDSPAFQQSAKEEMERLVAEFSAQSDS
jgi:carbonic anhydrase/acetyltransferase-like protein (isoleucine patch superfamily)